MVLPFLKCALAFALQGHLQTEYSTSYLSLAALFIRTHQWTSVHLVRAQQAKHWAAVMQNGKWGEGDVGKEGSKVYEQESEDKEVLVGACDGNEMRAEPESIRAWRAAERVWPCFGRLLEGWWSGGRIVMRVWHFKWTQMSMEAGVRCPESGRSVDQLQREGITSLIPHFAPISYSGEL